MKSPGLAPLFLAATLFMVPARAAEPPNLQQLRARMLEQFDENKDGRLDEAERAKAQKHAEELGFLPEGPLRAQLVQRFDRNANGRIDDDERAAVREFLRQRFPGGGFGNMPTADAPPPAPPVPETADPAKLALERTIRAAIATDPVQLKRFDRDRDGQISQAEWAMARPMIQDALGDALVLAAMASEEEEKKMKAVVEEVARRRQEDKNGVESMPDYEQRRLDRVAKEVERRRELRYRAEQTLEAAKDLPPPTRDYPPDEMKRLEAVAAEAVARRKERGKSGDIRTTPAKSENQSNQEAEEKRHAEAAAKK